MTSSSTSQSQNQDSRLLQKEIAALKKKNTDLQNMLNQVQPKPLTEDANWSTQTLINVAQILEQKSGTLANLESHAKEIMGELKELRKKQ